MTRWSDSVEPVVLSVSCGSSRHTLRWCRGAVELLDHHDVDAELALVAFGGDEPPCLTQLALWNDAVADGGFLGEWVDEELDQSRLWWLGMALERMRSEGFHEFLRELPVGRAARMGQFLTRFPAPWLDRAAAEVAERLVDGDGVVCIQAPRLVPIAIARRLRRAFVTSVGERQLALGAAALMSFRPQIVAGAPPSIEGEIRGRSSWARVTVDERWLFEVWGAGAAVVDGRLVLAIDDDGSKRRATIAEWRPDHERLVPVLTTKVIANDGAGWRVLG